MKNDDVLKKLESIVLPDITLESHYRSLNTFLLDEYESLQAENTRAGLSVNNLLSIWRKARVSRRVAVVAVPVVALLLFLLFELTGSFTGTSGVIARAYTAIENLESYRYIEDSYVRWDESGDLVDYFRTEFEYKDPDRYHELIDHVEDAYARTWYGYPMEIIVIGDRIFTRQYPVTPKTTENFAGMAPATKEETLEVLEFYSVIDVLPDEEIDGTDCYHYRGTVDMERWLDRMRPSFIHLHSIMTETFPWFDKDLDEYVKGLEDLFRTQEKTYEFWFGKDDYLVHQLRGTMQILPDISLIGFVYMYESTIKYYDFNEPVTIEAPLDESGELLEGWTVSSIE